MRRIVWWAVLILGLGAVLILGLGGAGVATQHFPRFHRYAMTQLDDTTTLDMVKDAHTGVCRLVYVSTNRYPSFAANARAVAYLGEVPCNPIPVPPKVGDAPPASAVR